MARFYFAEFTNTDTGVRFQKFGHTNKNDAQIRLNYITQEHPKFTAKVLASAFHKDVTKCQHVEERFKKMYPKNFWLEETISGVTEIVKLDWETRNKVIKAVRKINDLFKRECFGDKDNENIS